MIITRLIGGLGNQLFQYAAGRRLAQTHGTELKLDVTGFAAYKLHEYRLKHFTVTADEATETEIRSLKRVWSPSIFGAALRRLVPQKKSYIAERSIYSFDPAILELPNNVYLDGYWQNEKYFKDIAGELRKEYILGEPLSAASTKAQKLIDTGSSVAIHVRRADYVTDKNTQQVYATLGPDYYKSAVKKITEKVSNPRFFIFSDDIAWAKENFKLSYETVFMDFNGSEKNYEDLYLMSRCRHHIIANSSFSWWGAWLSQDQGSLTIAPKLWFREPKNNTVDRYPENWVKI